MASFDDVSKHAKVAADKISDALIEFQNETGFNAKIEVMYPQSLHFDGIKNGRPVVGISVDQPVL